MIEAPAASKYEKLKMLTQLPTNVTDDVAMEFLQNFYLSFPVVKSENKSVDEKEFLSLKSGSTSEESSIPRRVSAHDIIDHIGVGRLLNEFDVVNSLEPLSNIRANEISVFHAFETYLRSKIEMIENWKNSDQKIALKMWILKHSDTSVAMNSNVKLLWDEMSEDQILQLLASENRYAEALDIYKSDLEILRSKSDKKTDEEVSEFKILTEFDKINSALRGNDRENLFSELAPKIERRHVFEFMIRLNMLEWTEGWIDAILDSKDANPPEISTKILEENAELNDLFTNNPEYFDIVEDSPEHLELTAKNKEIYLRVQKKVLKLLNRVAPTEAKRYILLKHIEKQRELEKNKDLN
jgi:hypothetical protein